MRKKKLGRFEIKSDNISTANLEEVFEVKLLVYSAFISIVTLCFEHAEYFHISYFTYHLRYYIKIDHIASC